MRKAILRIWGSSSMNEILNVAGKEIVRREIMELCREAEPYGAGTPVLKAALRKTGHDLTDQELMRQVGYLEGKGLVHKEMEPRKDRQPAAGTEKGSGKPPVGRGYL